MPVAASTGSCPQQLSINPDLPTPYTCRCSAALHAGAAPGSGGVITVYREAGRGLYVGSVRNGITSSDDGRYANSLHFVLRAL